VKVRNNYLNENSKNHGKKASNHLKNKKGRSLVRIASRIELILNGGKKHFDPNLHQ